MIITVSGMVGSGKTTVASRAADVLRANGFEASVLRFQSLPCFTLLRSSLAPRPERRDADGDHKARAVRWKGYRPKRLGVGRTAVYLARILSFAVYRMTLKDNRAHIMNRYFYDLFTHYRLDSPVERACLWLLRVAMPRPDIAILVIANADTIAARRPDYSGEYLSAVGESYSRMRERFPELVEIRTDPTDGDVAAFDALLLAKARARG